MPDLAAPAPTTAGWRARAWRWWCHSPFQRRVIRVGLQCGINTFCLMAIFSYPPIWNALSFGERRGGPSPEARQTCWL